MLYYLYVEGKKAILYHIHLKGQFTISGGILKIVS